MILVIFPLSFLSFCFYSVTITFPMVTWSAFDRVDSASLPVPFLFVSGSLLFRLRSFSVPFRFRSFFDLSRLRFIPSRLSSVTSLTRSVSKLFPLLSFSLFRCSSCSVPRSEGVSLVCFVSFRFGFLSFYIHFDFVPFPFGFFSLLFSIPFRFRSYLVLFRHSSVSDVSDSVPIVSIPSLFRFYYFSVSDPLYFLFVMYLFRSSSFPFSIRTVLLRLFRSV